MARAQNRGGSSRAAAEVHEQGKTARTFARWNAAKVILPALFAAAGAYGVAHELAGKQTGVNVVLGISLTLVVPAAVAKVIWDRAQKRRLRQRAAELEQENRRLTQEVGELRARQHTR